MDEKLRLRAEQMSSHTGPQGLPTQDLLQAITDDARGLVQLEVELAREEAKLDLSSEMDLAKGEVLGAVCGLLGLNMLLISAVFALAPRFAWVAAFILGVALLAVAAGAAYFGFKRAERNPMRMTRDTLLEDLEWAKRQIK